MKIYQLSRECYPFANAGGLKEVVTGIGRSLAKFGYDSSVFIPCYGFINRVELTLIQEFIVCIKGVGIKIRVYYTEYKGIKIYFLDYPLLKNITSVYTYTLENQKENPKHKYGEGFLENDDINILFQFIFLEYVHRYLDAPDIISLHDGHVGLIPSIIKSNNTYNTFFSNSNLYFTIHNAGVVYHQRLLREKLDAYGLIKPSLMDRACYSGYIDPLFMASLDCTVLTVSPYYAKELLDLVHESTTENYGQFCINNSIIIKGIINGVDLKHYNSIGIDNLPSVQLKHKIKANIKNITNKLTDLKIWGEIDYTWDKPLFLFQNRLTEQKGINQLIESISSVLDSGVDSHFIIMGRGEHRYEKQLIDITKRFHNICYIQGYKEDLAHNLFIASDFFILTSLWEPCGLTDFEAQMAGSIPIVHNTGGLKKVIDGETGYIFDSYSELEEKIWMCHKKYLVKSTDLDYIRSKGYENIIKNYTWDMVVEKNYIPLFEKV